jgi:hypothetical protein
MNNEDLAYREIKKSDLFSAAWYLARYPDVAGAGIDPLLHYIQHGAAADYDPGPNFSTKAYLQRNADVARAGINPLLHYIRYGKDEGRDPSPLPSPETELEKMAKIIRDSGLFDANWYLARYPSVAAQGIDPVADYLEAGYREGRNPGPQFDTDFYLSEYQDVAQSGTNPLVHYLLYGRDEGRLPHEVRARTLERKLWAGFSRYALAELEAIKQSRDEPGAREARRRLVADGLVSHPGRIRTGARKLCFCLRLRETLAFSKKWALVAALCHMRLGEPDSALQLLNGIAKKLGLTPTAVLPCRIFTHRRHHLGKGSGCGHRQTLLDQSRFRAAQPCADRKVGPSKAAITGQSDRCGSVSLGCCNKAKVSIVMPAYNAAATISSAIDSILNQSWRDIELIIVDDCSSDDTFQIAQRYTKKDLRVKVLRQIRNMGAYAARNAGVRFSTGDFVTVHDCDDWSHPQKIETQMAPLIADSQMLGSFSFWVKVDQDMNIVGGWRPWGSLIEFNESSFLFRRSLIDAIGQWDQVRVAGDREFIWRAEAKYGKKAFVQVCPEAPLSFSLSGTTSLTQSSATHVKTVFYGLRRTYREAARWWHATARDGLYLHNGGQGAGRSFAAPEAILGKSRSSIGPVSQVLVSDFSRHALALDDRAVAVLQSIVRTGPTALFHWPDYATDADDPVDGRVFEIAAKTNVRLLVSGETIDAKTVVIVRPKPLQWLPDSVPVFNCLSVIIVDDQVETNAVHSYDTIKRNIQTVFGHFPVSISFAAFLDR